MIVRLPLGTRLAGRYVLEDLLGEGGMGSVYAARDTRTGSAVALKVLRPDLADDDDAVRRFAREAYSAAQVRHPRIVALLDTGVDPIGVPFLVYELVVGESLRARIQREGTLNAAVAVDFCLAMLDALAAAHAAGIVHRDVKPSNVLLATDAQGNVEARVIDFGISKSLSSPELWTRVTSTGEIVGTAQYMSPEQARGKEEVDARTDVWSAGAVLYEMLSGRPPYEARTATQTILKILTQEPPLLASIAPELPPELVIVVHRALARDRERRWPSAAAFREALARNRPRLSTVVRLEDATPDERATIPGFRDDPATDVVPLVGRTQRDPE